jgi:hypothetical protein
LFNDGVELVPMTLAYAADVVTWRYPAPYDSYDMIGAATGYARIPQTASMPSWKAMS